MGDVQAVAGLDRLPWLPDDTPARAQRGRRARTWPLWLAAAIVGLAAVAAAAYWLGTRSTAEETVPAASATNVAPVSVPLPEPLEVPAQPQAAPEPQPEVPLAAQPQVAPVTARPAPAVHESIARRQPEQARPKPRAPSPAPRRTAARPTSKPAPVTAAEPAPLPVWPVRAEQNSAGRLVRVGTFTSASQAKRGWTRIMRFYPGMKRLPALAVPIQAVPSGRRYYRLQMGTTSQAHSEVLCQRMRIIGVSCVVLDIGPTVRRAA